MPGAFPLAGPPPLKAGDLSAAMRVVLPSPPPAPGSAREASGGKGWAQVADSKPRRTRKEPRGLLARTCNGTSWGSLLQYLEAEAEQKDEMPHLVFGQEAKVGAEGIAAASAHCQD